MPPLPSAAAPILLLDLGNTRLKIGLWHADTQKAHLVHAVSHADTQTLRLELTRTVAALDCHPQLAVGVSVACQARMDEIESVLSGAKVPIHTRWIWPRHSAFGLTSAYPHPEQLGADRWAGMLGLLYHFKNCGRSVVLANFGTATTVDTLSRQHVFLGGLILPGVSMMQSSLQHGTARLPLARGDVADYPTDTHAAITTGVVAAQLGAVSRQLTLSQERDGCMPLVCVSGGAWHLLKGEWHRTLPQTSVTELPDVVLDGLAFYAQQAVI